MIQLESHAEGVILPVRAYPAARQNKILGEHDGSLRLAVTAAPDKGKANRAIVELLTTEMELPKSAVELINGSTFRQKRFLLRGLSLETADKMVQRLIDESY